MSASNARWASPTQKPDTSPTLARSWLRMAWTLAFVSRALAAALSMMSNSVVY
jgi:hypothetical protein